MRALKVSKFKIARLEILENSKLRAKNSGSTDVSWTWGTYPIAVNRSVSCPFLVNADMHSEWAYKAPVLLILACNMVFLIYIMTVSNVLHMY